MSGDFDHKGDSVDGSGQNIFVHQIFYSDETRRSLDAGFIPLDNSKNERPDWFEFWVIRTFLKNNPLDPNAWYGFLSPKFAQKTGLNSAFIRDTLSKLGPDFDVALFTSYADHLAIFQNPFEQGDRYHPGLLTGSQAFLDMIGVKLDLKALVTSLDSSVFSNYVIAKPKFWKEWLAYADSIFDLSERENAGGTQPKYFNVLVPHEDNKKLPMKVFIQERFATLVLSQGKYKVYVPKHILEFSQYPDSMRRFFVTCDFLKERYRLTGEPQYVDTFKKMRRDFTGVKFHW